MEQQNELLTALLRDPETLQSAIAMASSLFSGAPNSTPPSFPSPPPAPPPPVPDYDPSAELIAKALPMITQVMQTSQQAITPEKKALLQAVKPFLSEAAGQQIDHGMRLVMLAHIASSVLGQFGRKESPHV